MERIDLDTLVTVVDSSTFVSDYASRSPLAARPELGEGGNLRPVVDLLVRHLFTIKFVYTFCTIPLAFSRRLSKSSVQIMSSLTRLTCFLTKPSKSN